jgi:hypothetical protein
MKWISSTEALERLPGDRLHAEHGDNVVVDFSGSKWSTCDQQIGLSLIEENDDTMEAAAKEEESHDSVQTICSVMARFPDYRKQEACVAALARSKHATEEAVTSISKAMRTFPDAPVLQKAAIEFLKNVPNKLRPTVMSSGVLDLTVATMCDHPDLHDDCVDILHRFGSAEEREDRS